MIPEAEVEKLITTAYVLGVATLPVLVSVIFWTTFLLGKRRVTQECQTCGYRIEHQMRLTWWIRDWWHTLVLSRPYKHRLGVAQWRAKWIPGALTKRDKRLLE